MNAFENKVVLITGGSSGIGLAAAQEFHRLGGQVLITGRQQDKLDAAVGEIGDRVTGIQGDVSRLEDLERMMASVAATFGRIDVLFVNAGVAQLAAFENTSLGMFQTLMEVNVLGSFFTIQKALPLLGDGASVVLNTSFLGRVGVAGTSALSASKAAVRSLTRSLAQELLPRGIRVNSVSPGAIATPIYGSMGMDPATLENVSASILSQIPMKRFGAAEEVAKAVVFLASKDSSYMTGCDLEVDGGRTNL
jgi:NAD(P)-dependent dehydrogenase (short-subunit alcohol dehydrogenase family)